MAFSRRRLFLALILASFAQVNLACAQDYPSRPIRLTIPWPTGGASPFTICNTCRLPVPKVCVSLGECVNCTDTDLFCVDHCIGGESRKYCTHFVRLHTEGVHLIHENEVFDLFPTVGMPGQKGQDQEHSTASPAESPSHHTPDPLPKKKL